MLSISSLFAGVGGLEKGLEASGLGRVASQVEIDPYCCRVLERHWPGARRFGDIKNVSGQEIAADLVCGGFPCVNISRIGDGRGLDGEGSGLWREFVRIIGEARPEWVVAENVALLARRGLAAVLGDLAALGYAAWWDCVPASAVGAPHQRDRLFVVARNPAFRARSGSTVAPVANPDGDVLVKQRRREHIAQVARDKHEREGKEPAYGGRAGLRTSRGPDQPRLDGRAAGLPSGLDARGLSAAERAAADELCRGFPAPPMFDPLPGEPPRVAPTHPRWRDRHRAIGNAVVPAVGFVIGSAIRRIIESEQ